MSLARLVLNAFGEAFYVISSRILISWRFFGVEEVLELKSPSRFEEKKENWVLTSFFPLSVVFWFWEWGKMSGAINMNPN